MSNALPDWEDYMEMLKPIGEKIISKTQDPDNPQDRQESWRALMSALSDGIVNLVYADPAYPDFLPFITIATNTAAPVPDYLYKMARIDGSGVYRICGHRGTNLFTLFSIHPGIYNLGTGAPGSGTYDLDDQEINEDGWYEILLSNERPEGYQGNWWPLDPKSEWIGLRLASYDWLHEQDSTVAIDRLDVHPRRPRLSAEELARRMETIAKWTLNGTERFWDRVNEIHEQGVINRVEVHNWGAIGGALGQVYLEGGFDLEEDEALILEAPVPESGKYWSFLLGDEQFATIDWINHQCSLNGHQAMVDPDGWVRVVIAREDPGVPNWLDTGGYSKGIIQVRWNNCSSAPRPDATRVKLSELRKHLPESTPVVTPEKREAVLRERRIGAQVRRRW